MSILKYLDARLGEASTWATLAAVATLVHVNVDPGVVHALTVWGAGVSALLGVVLREAGSKPPAAIGADLLAQLVAMTNAAHPAPAEPQKVQP